MEFTFLTLIGVWLLIVIVVAIYSWCNKDRTVGAIFSFAALLSAIHLLQAVIYVLPWFEPLFDRQIVLRGFEQATLALLCFGAGAIIIFPLLQRLSGKFNNKHQDVEHPSVSPILRNHIAYIYIILGLVGYFVLGVVLSGVPSAQSFVSAVTRFWHIGSIIWLWQIFHDEKPVSGTLPITLIILLWPILTVARDGFLGFGMVPTLVVLVFVTLRTRRIWFTLSIMGIVGYVIFSIATVYFQSRSTIRDIVWNNNIISSPAEDIYNTVIASFRWFDINDSDQLLWIESRLNYNYPVGLVVERINGRLVEAGNGSTIESAVLMVVPRILWPEKPVTVGGSALFQYFTGIPIVEGTSVGLSPVVELYVNYQTSGVILGFLFFGILVALCDYGAAQALQRSHYLNFALWFMPIFGLILIQDDLFTIVGTTISGLIITFGINKLIRIFSTLGPETNSAARPPTIRQIHKVKR